MTTEEHKGTCKSDENIPSLDCIEHRLVKNHRTLNKKEKIVCNYISIDLTLQHALGGQGTPYFTFERPEGILWYINLLF